MKLHRALAFSLAFSTMPLVVACDDADAPPGSDVPDATEDTSTTADLSSTDTEPDAMPDTLVEDDATEDADTGPSGDTAVEDGHEGDVAHTTPHWTYEGEEGPEFWGELSEDWAVCGEGERQSPVDIPAVAATSATDLAFDYLPTPLELLDNGHTVKALFRNEPFSTVGVGERTFTLREVHFHAGSEHTLDGLRFDLELHLVHDDGAGQRAVVGLLFVEGDAHPYLTDWAFHLETATGHEAFVPEVWIQPSDYLPEERSTWRYHGSLTTPPCDENVAWFVMSTVQEVSAEQLELFKNAYDGNFRPTQPLFDRSFTPVEDPNR